MSISVIGLGYVGLPLAAALSRHYPVAGFDIDPERIAELRQGEDRTREVAPEALGAPSLSLSSDPADIAGADLFIVTVPTPVDEANRPDLAAVLDASRDAFAECHGDAIRQVEHGTAAIHGPAMVSAFPGSGPSHCRSAGSRPEN